MSKIKTVTMHQTTDGKNFKKVFEALLHQANVDRDEAFSGLVRRHYDELEDQEVVVIFLQKYAAELLGILKQWDSDTAYAEREQN